MKGWRLGIKRLDKSIYYVYNCIEKVISKMIEKLFTSKTRTRILRVLLFHPGEEFHLRELSRQVEITPIYVKKELENLKELNLVLCSKKGNLNLFQINKDSPLYPELKNIFLKTEFLTEIIKESFEKLEIDFAFIYGSFAKGEESEKSDIDLFVVGSIEEDKLIRIIQSLERKVGRELNYLLWKKDWLMKRKGRHHLLNEIAKNPIIMLVGKEDELRKIIGK